jgi:hypothetical protein
VTRPLEITSRQIRAAIKAGKAEGCEVIEVKVANAVIRYKPADLNKDGDRVDGDDKWLM